MNHNFAARHKCASQAKHKPLTLLVLNFRVYTLRVATLGYLCELEQVQLTAKSGLQVQIVGVETYILQLASYKLTRADIAVQCEF